MLSRLMSANHHPVFVGTAARVWISSVVNGCQGALTTDLGSGFTNLNGANRRKNRQRKFVSRWESRSMSIVKRAALFLVLIFLTNFMTGRHKILESPNQTNRRSQGATPILDWAFQKE